MAVNRLCLELFAGKFAVGGHRGSGMNIFAGPHPLIAQYQTQHPAGLVLRENTVTAFQRAAAAGASFVEFDVQVTKDSVPVVWHDDYLIYRQPGSEIVRHLISSLTAAEFAKLRQPGSSVQLLRKKVTSTGISETEFDDWNVEDELAGLPTLAELFSSIPESVGFDIEVKMTTPNDVISTDPAEIDRMLEPILAAVQQARQSSSRKIFFSSFDPEICQALRQSQPDLPVFFLSTGPGSWKPHSDPRRNSVEAAISWACENDLQGLVLDSNCFKAEPDAAKKAEQLGLATLTYGFSNNDPEYVLRQQQLGVAAVIVDNVPAIVKAIA